MELKDSFFYSIRKIYDDYIHTITSEGKQILGKVTSKIRDTNLTSIATDKFGLSDVLTDFDDMSAEMKINFGIEHIQFGKLSQTDINLYEYIYNMIAIYDYCGDIPNF
jgi:hypothetical protein